MASLNNCTFIGRLGKDAETKQVGETSVTKWSIAVSEKYKNKKGEQVENTEWINMEAWGKTGQLVQEYMKKGSLGYFEGKFKTTMTEKDGVKKYFTTIVVDTVQFLSKSDTTAPQAYTETTISTGEIPF